MGGGQRLGRTLQQDPCEVIKVPVLQYIHGYYVPLKKKT